MKNLKALEEKRSKLFADMKEIVTGAEERAEAIEGEVEVRYNDLKSELAKIDSTIAQVREIKEMEKTMETTVVVEKEVREDEAVEAEIREYKEAVRNGEQRAVNTAASGAGAAGVSIPLTIKQDIVKSLYEIAPALSLAEVIQATGKVRILKEKTTGTANWVGEGGTINPGDIELQSIELGQYKASTLTTITHEMLNDAGIDIEGYVRGNLVERLGKLINNALVLGTGTAQPQGLVGITNTFTTAVNTGVTADEIVKTFMKLHPDMVPGAAWFMNRNTLTALMVLKDGMNRPLLLTDYVSGQPAYKLMGLPVYIVDTMDNFGVGKKPIILANSKRAQTVNLRPDFGIQVLKEQFALQGAVGYLGHVFVDAKIKDDQAGVVVVMP